MVAMFVNDKSLAKKGEFVPPVGYVEVHILLITSLSPPGFLHMWGVGLGGRQFLVLLFPFLGTLLALVGLSRRRRRS